MKGPPRRFDHDECRALYATGEWTHAALGRKYGVSACRIGQVVSPRVGARVAAYKAAYQKTTCSECGGPCSWNATRNKTQPPRCPRCAGRARQERFRRDDDGAVVAVRCCSCHQWVPSAKFPKGSQAEGCHAHCRPCQTAARKAYRDRHRLVCEVCGERKVNPDGRRQTDYTVCRGCFNALRALYHTNVMSELIAHHRDAQKAAA